MIYAILHAKWYPDAGIFALALGWSVYSMILLWLSLQASFDVPQRSNAIRFKQRVNATLRHRGVAHPVTTCEISDKDVVLSCDRELALAKGLHLSIPACGLHEAAVSFGEEEAPARFVVTFDKLTIQQHRALVASLYCRAGQWDGRGVPEPVTFWRFLEAPFRMYPLAETR